MRLDVLPQGLAVAARPGIASRHRSLDPGGFDNAEQHPGKSRVVETVEEQVEIGFAQGESVRLPFRQFGHKPSRGLHVEAVGPELAESQLVEDGESVYGRVEGLVWKVVDDVRQVHAATVVPGVDAIAGADGGSGVTRKLGSGLDVNDPSGDALGEQRQHPVDVGERGQGQTTSTMPATASWTWGSSDTASTMAISAARRGSMPRWMSSPA